MASAWRIVPEARLASAFNGEGARRHGGRWNSPGHAVVYCSSSRALAALEILVHLNPRLTIRYVIFQIEFPERLVEDATGLKFAAGWDAEPPGAASMRVGDNWIREGRSAVLAVPSVLTGEPNYLLNPAHRDFPAVRIARPEMFTFDRRLIPAAVANP